MKPTTDYAQVDRRAGMSLAEFRKDYLLAGRPVVITDAMDNWNTSTIDFDGLTTLCGDEEVLVWRYDPDREFTPGDVKYCELREFIDNVRDADITTFPYYLRDNWQLCDKYSELMDAHSVPEYFFDWFRYLPAMFRMPYPRIFIGPKGAVTPLHIDVWNTHAWLSQIEGRKRWLMFSPDDAPNIYDCAVRCESPDLEKHPLYARARPLECIIEPGDTVYVPSGWAHWVESLAPGVSLTYNYMGPGCFGSCLKNTAIDVAGRASRRLRRSAPAEA